MKVMAMGRKKEAGKGGESERPDVKFDGNDLMELEFGRLLGEPRQATLAKVFLLSNNSHFGCLCTLFPSMFVDLCLSL